jgi:phage-related protein
MFNLLTCPEGLGSIVSFIKNIFGLIQIVVPIILIVVGAFDLAKAVMASDEKEIKGATSKFIKRAIAAVAVFFAVTIVDALMGIVGKGEDNGDGTNSASWSACWNSR